MTEGARRRHPYSVGQGLDLIRGIGNFVALVVILFLVSIWYGVGFADRLRVTEITGPRSGNCCSTDRL